MNPRATNDAGNGECAAAGETVTLRIDQLKDRASLEGGPGWKESWLLVKRNEKEAVVEQHPLFQVDAIADSGTQFCLLAFWRLFSEAEQEQHTAQIQELEAMRARRAATRDVRRTSIA